MQAPPLESHSPDPRLTLPRLTCPNTSMQALPLESHSPDPRLTFARLTFPRLKVDGGCWSPGRWRQCLARSAPRPRSRRRSAAEPRQPAQPRRWTRSRTGTARSASGRRRRRQRGRSRSAPPCSGKHVRQGCSVSGFILGSWLVRTEVQPAAPTTKLTRHSSGNPFFTTHDLPSSYSPSQATPCSTLWMRRWVCNSHAVLCAGDSHAVDSCMSGLVRSRHLKAGGCTF